MAPEQIGAPAPRVQGDRGSSKATRTHHESQKDSNTTSESRQEQPAQDQVPLSQRLLDAGIPVVVCDPVAGWLPESGRADVLPPGGWPSIEIERARSRFEHRLDRRVLGMVGGHGIDVLDIDAKTGATLDVVPESLRRWGVTRTPGGGWHVPVPSTGLGKGELLIDGKHVGDYVGGTEAGGGRLLAFLPGSYRPKYPGVDYVEEQPWDVEGLLACEPPPELIEILTKSGRTDTAEAGQGAATEQEIQAFLDQFPSTSECRYGMATLADLLDEADAVESGGRHSWCVRSMSRVVELVREGCLGTDAIGAVEAKLHEVKAEGGTDPHAVLAWSVANASGVGCGQHRPIQDDGLWEQRDYLTLIRDHARSVMVGPDALLAVVLAKTAAEVSPHVQLPAIVGARASLNLFVGLVAGSSGGKSAVVATANMLHDWRTEVMQPGSGEGLAHLFAKREKVGDERVVIRYEDRTMLDIDEIDTLTALGQRQGASLQSVLRTCWSGGKLGHAYADPDKRLPIGAHTYRACLVVGIQPMRAQALFDQTEAGTPQRFIWAGLTDPGAQWEEGQPSLPGQMPWRVPPEATVPFGESEREHLKTRYPRELVVGDSIWRTIRLARFQALQGGSEIEDGHRLQSQLRVAAVLALLDGRMVVNESDWYLASLVMVRSDHARHAMESQLRAKAKAVGAARVEARADAEVVIQDRTRQAIEARAAGAVGRHVQRHDPPDGCLRRCIKDSIRNTDRREISLGGVIELAVELGYIEPQTRLNHQGKAEPVSTWVPGRTKAPR